jgi:hypothetical protein
LEEAGDQTLVKKFFEKMLNPIYADVSCGEYTATIRLG